MPTKQQVTRVRKGLYKALGGGRSVTTGKSPLWKVKYYVEQAAKNAAMARKIAKSGTGSKSAQQRHVDVANTYLNKAHDLEAKIRDDAKRKRQAANRQYA